MLTCDSTLTKIWLFMLFSGFMLLLICISIGSIPGYDKNILLYIGVTGGGLIVICLLVARYYKPLRILISNEEDETINRNILVLENERQRNNINVSNVDNINVSDIDYININNIKHMNPVVAVEVYEQRSQYINLPPESVTIAVPINNV